MDFNSSSSSNNNNNSKGLPLQDPRAIMQKLKDRYPTMYVRAESSTFKHVVQSLTGSIETTNHVSSEATPSNPRDNIPPIQTMSTNQQSNLHQRRISHSNLSPVLPLLPSNPSSLPPSPRNPGINLSPRNFNFTTVSLGPATPLIPGRYGNEILNPNLNIQVGAIQEGGVFLDPSRTNVPTPRDAEPRLLPLFPTTSPHALDDSSSV